MTWFRDLPVAWLQLSHSRAKLAAAIIGIIFADLLIWMQLGFRAAAIDSALYIHKQLNGELVILNPQTEQIEASKPFPRSQLARARTNPNVDAYAPLYTGSVQWKDPWTGIKRNLFAYGITLFAPPVVVPGVSEKSADLHAADTYLLDTRSRNEFVEILKHLGAGERVTSEVNGRQLTAVGTTTIGASFQVDGNLVMSDANFFRMFPARSPAAVDVGVLKLCKQADLLRVKHDLQQVYGSSLLVLTAQEFIDRETEFFTRTRPVNFIFTMGTAVGFFVGFAIVYQILFTDVNNHLPQYATLKAIGYTDRYLRNIVLQEGLILSLFGYFPGTALSAVLYQLTAKATSLPMEMTLGRGILILFLTITMCVFSGLMAMRKLNQADPADVF